jgi:hypothetical protein
MLLTYNFHKDSFCSSTNPKKVLFQELDNHIHLLHCSSVLHRDSYLAMRIYMDKGHHCCIYHYNYIHNCCQSIRPHRYIRIRCPPYFYKFRDHCNQFQVLNIDFDRMLDPTNPHHIHSNHDLLTAHYQEKLQHSDHDHHIRYCRRYDFRKIDHRSLK